LSGSCRFVNGSYVWLWMKSGNFSGSRIKKIGVIDDSRPGSGERGPINSSSGFDQQK